MKNLENNKTQITKKEKHAARTRSKLSTFLPSVIFASSAMFVFLVFMAFPKEAQSKYINLILSIISFLMMMGFVYHHGEFRRKGVTFISGKPAEIFRKAGIVIFGFTSIYLLLSFLKLI